MYKREQTTNDNNKYYNVILHVIISSLVICLRLSASHFSRRDFKFLGHNYFYFSGKSYKILCAKDAYNIFVCHTHSDAHCTRRNILESVKVT